MRVRIYRNLDQPFVLFGLQGKYIAVAGMCLPVILIVSFVIGSIGGTFAGLTVACVLLAAAYLAITEIQQKFGLKAISRVMSWMGMPRVIVVRSRVWRRLI